MIKTTFTVKLKNKKVSELIEIYYFLPAEGALKVFNKRERKQLEGVFDYVYVVYTREEYLPSIKDNIKNAWKWLNK